MSIKKKAPTFGAKLIAAMEEAVQIETGKKTAPRMTRASFTARSSAVKEAPAFDRERITEIRRELDLSQPVFAQAFNVSPETVKAWEQGKREPDGAARRLLQIAEKHPQWILEAVQASGQAQYAVPKRVAAKKKASRTRTP